MIKRPAPVANLPQEDEGEKVVVSRVALGRAAGEG